MPDYTGGNVIGDRASSFKRYKVMKIGLVDALGGIGYSRIRSNGSDMTRTEVDQLRIAIGDASNAGVFHDGIEDYHATAVQDARAINDTLGTVSSVAVFVFQREDNAQIEERLEIPAPKREMLVQAGDEYYLDTQSAMAQAIINNAEPVFNAGFPDGEPEYRFVRGYLSDRKKSKVGGKTTPNVIDPVV